MTPSEFLAFWFDGCVGDIRLVALDPEGRHAPALASFSAPHDFAAMEKWALTYSALRRNVYFKVLTHKPGSSQPGTKGSAFEMPGFFAELDTYKDVSKADTIAHLEEIGAADRVSVVVDSGGVGFHVYAKFEKPLPASPLLEATNYAFGKWLLVQGRPERFDLSSLLRVPGTGNYPDEKKRTKYNRVDGQVAVFDTSDKTFNAADYDDLREQFPHEARSEQPIDAEPATTLPEDWESRLERTEWAQQLWKGTAQVDGDASPSGYNFRLAAWLERHTSYTDAEKLAILAAHYPQGMGEQRPTDELQRKARRALEAARSHRAQDIDSPQTEAELPTIQVNDRQFADVAKDAWAAVKAANDPPSLFVRDGRLVAVKTVDGVPRIGEVSEDAMYGRLSRVARWIKIAKNGTTNTFLPKQVAKDMLADPDATLPVLHAVIETPVFGRDGQVVATPGYHREDAIWLNVPASLAACCPPASPTRTEIGAARALLLDDLLVDFQFATEADRAHAVAAILLQFVRRMIDGCTPLHLIEAASPGTGKGLLADVISLLSTGQCCAPTTLPREEAEVRKKITSMLMTAPPVVLLDNVGHRLDSADLASALTADPWQDRLLGTNRTIRVPNKATWLLTANNPDTTLEIARRIVRIRIEPGTDRPWLLVGFKHDPLREWVRANRARLVGAVLVLIQGWVAAGRPAGTRVLGSFEEWSKAMGGILEVASIPGFLGNLDELYDEADEEGRQWRAFCRLWWDEHAGSWVSAGQLRQLAEEHQLLGDVLTDSKTERSANIRLGKALHERRGRHFGPWRIVIDHKDPSHARYRLVQRAETTDSTSVGTVTGGAATNARHDQAVAVTDQTPDVSPTSGPHRDPHRDENFTPDLDLSEVPDVTRCFSEPRDQQVGGEALPL